MAEWAILKGSYKVLEIEKVASVLKVHKREKFFVSDFEFFIIL